MLSIRKIGVLSRRYRNLNRYRRILTVLFKYGFGDLVERLRIDQYLEIGLQWISRNRRPPQNRNNRGQRLRHAIEELGPAFIKLGQILSTRPDLMPPDILEELSKLQDRVPPMAFESARSVVELELNTAIDHVFVEFGEAPIASGSIGQVHRAVTVDEEVVAVKVQRPNIRKVIETDLEILLHLATLMERNIEEMAIYRPVSVVEELARTLEKEVDYNIEANSMQRMASYFRSDNTVLIPMVFRQMSTSRVLTMEYITGVKISHIQQLESNGYNPKELCLRGAHFYLNQIFKHGFFHADPHPGNLVVVAGNVLCLFDYGMMGSVDSHTRDDFVDLIDSIVHRQVDRTTRVMLRLTDWDREPDMRQFKRDTADFIERHLYKPLREIEIGRLLTELLNMSARHRLIIPSDIYLMIKALATMEGVGRTLDPDFDMISAIAPFVEHAKLARYGPKRMGRDLYRFGSDLLRFADRFPKDLQELLKILRREQLTVQVRHNGIDRLMESHHQISNRIAFSIIIGALLIGSALMVLSKIPPIIFGLPLIGLIGFVFAAVMGIWLLVAILRKGRL